MDHESTYECLIELYLIPLLPKIFYCRFKEVFTDFEREFQE